MNIIKKNTLFFVATAALLVTIIFASSAAAAEGFKISAAKVEGGAGGQVTINVMADQAKGSEGGQFTLTFDQNLVRPVSIEPGDLVLAAENSLHMGNLDFAPGELIFMWVTANADTKDNGVICRVTFDLLKAGTTAINFKDLIIVADTGNAASAVNSQIKVNPASAGGGTLTGSDQETVPEGGSPEQADASQGEGVVGDDDEGGIKGQTDGEAGINPILAVIPVAVIIVLGVVYYFMKKPMGKK